MDRIANGGGGMVYIRRVGWHGTASLPLSLSPSPPLRSGRLLLLVSSSVGGDGLVFSLSMVFMQADRARDSDFSSSTYPLALANSEVNMPALRCAVWMSAVVTVVEKDAARPKDTAELRLSQIKISYI